MYIGTRFSTVVNVYRDDKLIRVFEKLNDDPLRILTMKEENGDFTSYFMWEGRKYYLRDFIRIRGNRDFYDEEKLFPPEIGYAPKWYLFCDRTEHGFYVQLHKDGEYVSLYSMLCVA